MKILISGARGLVGTELSKRLKERGDKPIHLVRSTQAGRDEVTWNPYREKISLPEVEGFDAWVHLSGASIGEKRLSTKQKEVVWDSRVVTTEFITKTFAKLTTPPKTFISASAVGYYGNRGDDILAETEPNGSGFLATLCQYWETTANEGAEFGPRVVNLRSGVVLSKDGGALQKQIPIFKLVMGGRLGSGKQWMSWISLDDEVRAIMHILDNQSIVGPVNAVAPNPVTNYEYTLRLGLALNRPAFIPTPAKLLNLVMGKTLTDDLLLNSQRAVPDVLTQSGFEFEYPFIEDALEHALHGDIQPDEEADAEAEPTGKNDETKDK